jgi:3-hydroxyisobutyrate dehydrogenase-like beta-hydroxyacid dehydrogenase
MTRTDLPALSVGWLGTGHMGAALAARIGRAGMDLTVWNRTRSKAEPLVDAGAKVADEPVVLADRDLVFTMVSTSADLEQVVDRLLADPDRAPRILVDCSTVSTEASARVREVASARGVAFLASPVSGNGKVVAAGKLSLVCSGPQEAYDEIEPVLNLLGRHVTYVGDGEKARLVKICHNIMLGVVAQNLAEITVLAEKGGVPRAAMLDFLNNSVMGSMFTTYKSPAYVNLDFTPTFTPVLLRKDLDLGLRAADELGVPMPVTAAAREPVQAAIAQGRTQEDFAVLVELQARNSGYEIVPEDVEVDDGLAPLGEA